MTGRKAGARSCPEDPPGCFRPTGKLQRVYQKHPAVEGGPALPQDGQRDVRDICRSEAGIHDIV